MTEKGITAENFNPRRCSKKKSMKSSKDKGNSSNVIVIDVDSDPSSDVIVIDITESVQDDSQGPRERSMSGNCAFDNVISIDDDDESNISDQPGAGPEGCDDLDSDATSCRPFSSAEKNSSHSSWFGSDDCQITREKGSPSGSRKCRKTYGTASSSNHYGLFFEPESDSSDSDFSDCEIMEDSGGKLREQWEQAHLRRRNRAGLDDQGSASCSPSDACQNAEQGKESVPHPKATACSNSSNSAVHKEKSYAFAEAANDDLGPGFLNPEGGAPFSSGHKYDEPYTSKFQSGFSQNPPTGVKDHCSSGGETCGKCPSSTYQSPNPEHAKDGYTGQFTEEQIPKGSSLKSNLSDVKLQSETDFNKKLSRDDSEELFKSKQTNDHDEVGLTDKNCGDASERFGADAKESYIASPLSFGKSVIDGAGAHQVTDRTASMERANKTLTDSATIGDQSGDRGILQAKSDGVMLSAQENIITDREKHKETDEYKRAMEEEWRSRQNQLRIQAEEAQRLRKKRKAESMRLLEMERRQKQRLEEIRDTQKKDEEKMNLKEQLRGLVRKELNNLELCCFDMASLLRGLGFDFGGSSSPSSEEVHTAYKRALLKFHPDRASRTDIRQQVEAEEKFKLIARMKEKFS